MSGCGKVLGYRDRAYALFGYPVSESRDGIFIHCPACFGRIASEGIQNCIPGAAAKLTACGEEATTANFFAAANPLASVFSS